jgi:hypothetical protein
VRSLRASSRRRAPRAPGGCAQALVLYHLRHACASLLLDRGISVWDVSLQLGHSDGGRLVRTLYGHPSEQASRERRRLAMSQRPAQLRGFAGLNARRLARVTDTEPTHKTELASVAIKEVVCGNAWDRLVQVVSRNPPAGCNNSKSGRCWRSSHSRQVPTRRSGYRTTMQRGLEWLAANLADGRCSVLPTQTPSASTRPTTKHSAAARYQSAPFRSSTVSQSSGWRIASGTSTRSRYPTRQDHASRGNSDATCMTASVHNTP